VHFNVADAVVLLLFAAAAVDGARRGFAFYALELLALGLGAAVALFCFAPLGGVFQRVLGADQNLIAFAAFLLLLVVVHGVAQLITQTGISRVGEVLSRALSPRPYRVVSAAPAAGTVCLLAVLVFNALAVLPNDAVRALISGSAIASGVNSPGPLQQQLRAMLVPSPAAARIVDRAPESNPGEDIFYKLKFPSNLQVALDPDGERTMLNQLNQARSSNGLSPLNLDSRLQQAAREHSYDMYQRHYFSHRTPDGKTPYDRLRDMHFRYVTAGENLAFAPDEGQAWQALMSSPDHRANILNPDFRCVGIGAYKGLDGFEEMFTQEFADCAS
jgi:uncharacterized protein YkwD